MATHDTYSPVFNAYVDKDIQPLFNCDSTSFNGEYKYTKAAVYGSSDEDLKEQLDEFKNFPGSLNMFGSSSRIHSTSWPVYPIVGNQTKTYTYKQDAMTQMMQYLPDPLIQYQEDNTLALYILEGYMKYKELQLEGVCELIRVDDTEFENLGKQLEDRMKDPIYFQSTGIAIELLSSTLSNICPDMNTAEVEQRIRTLWNDSGSTVQVHKVIHVVLTCLNTFEEFFGKEWFKPNQRQPLRIFTHRTKKFFLVEEVLKVLELEELKELVSPRFKNSLREKVEKDELATMSYDRLKRAWKLKVEKKRLEDIEMIEFPIRQTKHRAIFIPYSQTKHCILVADAFLEALRWTISVKGIFRVLKEDRWNEFLGLFDGFGQEFRDRVEGPPRLIEVNEAENIKEGIKAEFNAKFGNRFIYLDARIIDVDDWTYARFHVELNRLASKLFDCFPNIHHFVERILVSIQEKPIGTLQRSDMYEALERIQILAFFDKCQDIQNWLNSQGRLSVFAVPEQFH